MSKKIEVASLCIAFVSLVIAAVALVVAYQSNSLTTDHNRKSTDPYLIFEVESIPHADPTENQLSISVRNVGLGPAIVTGFEAYKNEQLVSGRSPVNGHDLAASFGLIKQATSRDELRHGLVIPPNERVSVFKVTKWHDPLGYQQFNDMVNQGLRQHKLVVCYRSVYSDRNFASLNNKEEGMKTFCASPNRFGALPDPMRIEIAAPQTSIK
jgi:hypothetical protein